MRQTMVDSWHCLDRFVPEGRSQVSRWSEVGNTKRRSLNTQLSSGTSAGTFAVSAGPYRNYHAKATTKNKPWHVFGTISKKGLENWLACFEPKNSWFSFSRGSEPAKMMKIRHFRKKSIFKICTTISTNRQGSECACQSQGVDDGWWHSQTGWRWNF